MSLSPSPTESWSVRRLAARVLCVLMLLQGPPLLALEHASEEAAQARTKAEETTTGPSTPAAIPWRSVADREKEAASKHGVGGRLLDAVGALFAMAQTPAPSAPPRPPSKGRGAERPAELPAVESRDATESIPFAPGWNFLSLPELPTEPSPATLLASAPGAESIWVHDQCDPVDPWKVYDPSDAGSDLTTLDVAKGFWLDATAVGSLPVDGEVPASTTFQLCTGWNLIGYPSAVARHPRAALAPIEGKYLRIFGYDAFDVADPWEIYDVAVPAWANDLELLQPGRGYWILVTEDVTFQLGNDGPPPEVAFTAPQDLDVVTQPTDVLGTVQSPLLAEWTLAFRSIGSADWIEIGQGHQPLDAGKLGNLDPTLLQNGLYELRLQATDVAGQQVEERIAVSVEGQMKIGHFTLSFIDLAVPLSGLDIEVIRTYDSRLRHEPGDFGHGWTLDIRQGSYQNNRPPGDGWRIPETQGPWGLPCSVVQETKSHLTVVRLSDQEVYRFRLTLKDPGTIIGGCIARAEFEWVDGPLPGTTLEILGNDEVLYRNDSGDVIDPDTFELFVPDDVKLTTRDGRIFHLDLQDGVTHLEDLHGNTLDITLDGITHSSGRGVEFVRDGEGRITKIVDPLGKENIYSYTPGAGGGDLTSTTDRVGATTTFTYRDHYLEDIHNALGIRAVRTEYDDSGRMVRMVDAAGKEVSFEHDLDARREVVTNRLGFTRILEYDERGNVTRETDELDAVTVRTYDGKDRLRSETDPLNRTTHFTYDAKSDLREIRDPLDHVTKFTYHELGSPETIEDPLGHVTTNVYDSVGNLRSTTDAENHTTTFEYTPKGELREITDPLNHVTRFIYDAFGNLRRETDALGHATRYTYDDNGVRLTETRTRTLPDGTTEDLVTRFTPDDLGRVTAVEAPDGSVTRTEYDLLGRMRSSTDALGRTTRHTHDAVGNLVRTQYPDDLDEVRTYDAESRLETMTDRGGRTTTYGYDKVGRLRETIYPIVDGVAAKVTNTYDVAGQLEAITDARNHTTNYLYDDAGRRTDVIDPFGHTTKLGYDSAGRRTTVRDERLHTTTFGYDKVGRLLTTTFPDATIHRQSYDGLGRRVTETDANQRTTTFGYDALGRLTSVTDALDQVTSYTYDEVGSFLSQTDANDHTTRFEYDRLGRQIARILPDGARESMAYFADGTLQSHTDFNGATRRYRYDSLGRLKDRIYPGGETVSFTYTPTGQRETATDARGVTSYQYDARDRLREKVAPTGHRLVYGYDLAGNRNFLEATVGAETFTTRYTHDALNRLETVEDPQGGVYTHRYDQAGNRESLSYPNGVATRYEHDSQNRLTLIETTNAAGDVLQSYVYTLGNSGHRDRIDEHDGTVRAYKYDDLYRLEQEKVTQAGALVYQTDWIYDPVGNRESQTWTDADGTQTVTGYAYDVRDRLQSETRGGEVTSYGWDANGNMTRRGDVTYSWDVDNRLVSAQLVDGSSLSTVYDVDGEQVGETWSPAVGGQESTAFLVDTNRGLSQRLASVQGGLVTALHTFGGDSVLATSGSGSSPSYVHRDALDSTRLLTDGAGVVEEQLEYSAYGETKEGAGAPVVHRFTGQVFDDRIDLAYHRARWMAPTLGVFAGMDPWLGRAPDPVTLHRYGYGSMDPVNHVDPTGLFSVARGLTAVAVALTVAVSFTALDAFVINRFQKSRSLTVGEKDLARSVFGDAIDLEKVEIRHNRFVWFQNFNLRWFRRARYMAPDGNIYVHPDWPSELASDLAKSDGPTFIHEMVHVWQHQQGRIVWLERGLEHEYSYQLIEGASFSDYGIEQQAMIVEDYYSIRRFDSPEALLMRGGLRLSKEDVPWFEEIIPFVE